MFSASSSFSARLAEGRQVFPCVFKVEGLDHKCSDAPQLAEGLVYGAFAILLIFVLAVFFAGECTKQPAPTEMVDGAKFGHAAPAATLGHAYNV